MTVTQEAVHGCPVSVEVKGNLAFVAARDGGVQIYDLTGPGAVSFADYLAVNKVDKPVGSSVSQPE